MSQQAWKEGSDGQVSLVAYNTGQSALRGGNLLFAIEDIRGMKQTPIKPRGKRSREREKGMRDAAPTVCRRAGGEWCGWTGERCVNARCEMVGEDGVRCMETRGLEMCHIQGRGQQGDESPENIIVMCQAHHHVLDHGPADVREAMRERARRIVNERNEAMA